MPIEWGPEFETGEARVDAQHKRLFEYVNELHSIIEQVQSGVDVAKQDIDDLLFHLESYVTVHFAYEELCMATHKCPKAAQNKDAHNKLIEFYGEFLERAKQELTLDMLITLEGALVSWLTNHICRIDTDIKQRLAHEAAHSQAMRKRMGMQTARSFRR